MSSSSNGERRLILLFIVLCLALTQSARVSARGQITDTVTPSPRGHVKVSLTSVPPGP